MKKYSFNQVLEISDNESRSTNRLAIQAGITGNLKDRDKTVENISGFCNDAIKKYMDSIDEWRR